MRPDFCENAFLFPPGGESTGLIDTAIMAEELYAVNASVTLTLMATVLGLLPLLIGGTEEQRSRLLPPFLKQAGAPGGGNVGVRRRRLHAILQRPEYDPFAALQPG